jgi:hypothetical protein
MYEGNQELIGLL